MTDRPDIDKIESAFFKDPTLSDVWHIPHIRLLIAYIRHLESRLSENSEYIIKASEFNPEKHEVPGSLCGDTDVEWCSTAAALAATQQVAANHPIVVRDKARPPRFTVHATEDPMSFLVREHDFETSDDYVVADFGYESDAKTYADWRNAQNRT